MKTKTLWIGFILVLIISFGILGYFGREIYREAPPIPEKVISHDRTLFHFCCILESVGSRNFWFWGFVPRLVYLWTERWLVTEEIIY